MVIGYAIETVTNITKGQMLAEMARTEAKAQ